MSYTGSLLSFSNRADWNDRYRLIDGGPDGSGEDIDLTGCTLVLGVYDENGCLKFTGSTDDGTITLLAHTDPILSVVEWMISKDITKNFCAGTYKVGVTASLNEKTEQLIDASVACTDGNVP